MNIPFSTALQMPAWLWLSMVVSVVFFASQASAAPATNAVRVLSIEGEAAQAEISRAGATAWDPAYAHQVLLPGDRGRTGPRAKMLLRMSDLSTLRVRERSQFEIKPPPEPAQPAGLALLRGMIYLFHRDKPGTTRIQSKTALAATRGTEFLVEVDEATDRLTLTLIDGAAELSNADGSLQLKTGEQGVAEPGRPPRKTAVIYTINLLQWCLYYPGVLDADELGLDAETRETLRTSLTAYREGDLPRALAAYPLQRKPASADETIYLAALLLSAGHVNEAQALLDASRLASALRLVIEATRHDTASRNTQHATRNTSPSEALAASYQAQSERDLPAALDFARQATDLSPKFGFAWARVAELEFSFGRIAASRTALEKALAFSPRNAQAIALKGFLLSAENKIPAAIRAFDEAIAADSALGNAWLGRGLCRFCQSRVAEGREDLQIAAALEPQRALLRSYLGKAFADTGDRPHSTNELALARSLDPFDPTPWLYSALLLQQGNQINEAIRDLERSQELNDHRALYRSRLLLDQDRAVRSANLANLYADAGLTDVAVREAARAVNTDYANYSAHLFLADSYARLNNPGLATLRYETAQVGEYLVANLLAPPGAGLLSPAISQQEYSRLFESDRPGFTGGAAYSSRGDWLASGAFFGSVGPLSYSLDGYHQSRNGQQPNNDLELTALSLQLKQQVTAQDGLYLQAIQSRSSGGDLAQYYAPTNANRGLRFAETQEPILLAGYHREWTPGVHTLALGARLEDELSLSNPGQGSAVFRHATGSGPVVEAVPLTVGQRYRSRLEIYSGELQQIFQLPRLTAIVGGRLQAGTFDTRNTNLVTGYSSTNLFLDASFFSNRVQKFETDFDRLSLYAYEHWEIAETLRLIGGVSYDRVHDPENFRYPPISDDRTTRDLLAPKAGAIWTPARRTTLRAGYSQSLGGVSFDQSFQLEPSQVAGFNQAWRSLIPESLAGPNAAPAFENWGVALDQSFPTRTYLGLTAEMHESEVNRVVGVWESYPPPVPPFIVQSGTRERLDYRERSLTATLHQLLGDEWSLGTHYRVSRAELETELIDVPASALALDGFRREQDQDATLHQAGLFLFYNHPSGFFGQWNGQWFKQVNDGSSSPGPGDEFWQFNLFAGYRFPRRRAEVSLGVLNLTDHDYRLNPLNVTAELPRERTLMVTVRVNF